VNDVSSWGLDQATDEHCLQEAERIVDTVFDKLRQPLIDAVVGFFEKQISPHSLMAFEVALFGLVREMGRQVLELVLNACEPGQPDKLPKDIWFESGGYRRRHTKTANRHVSSRFGDIVLHRCGYRS
jgi:hypothetical protein